MSRYILPPTDGIPKTLPQREAKRKSWKTPIFNIRRQFSFKAGRDSDVPSKRKRVKTAFSHFRRLSTVIKRKDYGSEPSRTRDEGLLWHDPARISSSSDLVHIPTLPPIRLTQDSPHAGPCQICEVCRDVRPALSYEIDPPTAHCRHPVQICDDCVDKWIASQVSHGDCLQIKCPSPDCRSIMDYEDIRRAATEDTFANYDKMLTIHALSQEPGFAWCIDPNCRSGQINRSSGSRMVCQECTLAQCPTHARPWHNSETCAQYDMRMRRQQSMVDERASERYIERNAKKCPGPNCDYHIQRTDGCDAMTCESEIIM